MDSNHRVSRSRFTADRIRPLCQTPIIQLQLNLEEDVRFELTELLHPSVFKTDAIGHSTNLPFVLLRRVFRFASQLFMFNILSTSFVFVNNYFNLFSLILLLNQ